MKMTSVMRLGRNEKTANYKKQEYPDLFISDCIRFHSKILWFDFKKNDSFNAGKRLILSIKKHFNIVKASCQTNDQRSQNVAWVVVADLLPPINTRNSPGSAANRRSS
jgi:hypothetical protein